MNRIVLISGMALAGVGGLYAGSFTPGAPNPVNLSTASASINGGSFSAGAALNKNLAKSGYLPCNSNDSCASGNTTVNPEPSGTSTGFSTVLFNSSQVPFDIASGGTNSTVSPYTGDTNNIWAPGNTAGNQTVTIGVGNYNGTAGSLTGVDDVDQIWTMLNDWYATAGYQGLSITLNGENNAGTASISETINLEAGIDYRSIGNASNDPTTCDIANIGTASLGTNCTGESSPMATGSATDSRSSLSNTSGVSVTVYNSVFQTADTATPTANQYWLDAQDINLGGAFLNGWVNTVTITSKDGSGGLSEKGMLSALTVDSVPSGVPEPGTVALFGGGLSLLAICGIRRSKKV